MLSEGLNKPSPFECCFLSSQLEDRPLFIVHELRLPPEVRANRTGPFTIPATPRRLVGHFEDQQIIFMEDHHTLVFDHVKVNPMSPVIEESAGKRPAMPHRLLP